MTTFGGQTVPPLFGGGGGLPFSGFFIGFGNVGWGGGDVCIPHPDTQVGDFLFVGNSTSTLVNYTVIQSVQLFGMTPFIRTATLTAADNISSGSSGIIRQIYTVRSPGGGFTNAGFAVSNMPVAAQIPFPVPAQIAGAGDHAIIRYQGWKNLSGGTASSIDEGAVDMTLQGTRIATPIIAFVGYKFQQINASVPEANLNYAVEQSVQPISNTFRHALNTI